MKQYDPTSTTKTTTTITQEDLPEDQDDITEEMLNAKLQGIPRDAGGYGRLILSLSLCLSLSLSLPCFPHSDSLYDAQTLSTRRRPSPSECKPCSSELP